MSETPIIVHAQSALKRKLDELEAAFGNDPSCDSEMTMRPWTSRVVTE
jgi:hypothetical protein